MPTETATDSSIDLPDAPAIAGLTWRYGRGAADYPGMVAVRAASALTDHIADAPTVEGLAHRFANRKNFQITRDLLIAEIDAQIVAYWHARWSDQLDGTRICSHFGSLHPTRRGQGLEQALLHWGERHLRATVPDARPHPRLFDTGVADTQPALEALLHQEGYTPTRHFYDMLRPDLEAIPDLPLPAGLEVRPVQPAQYRTIWEAEVEAFRDHWGEEEADETDFARWQTGPQFQPHLWQVAWDGDQVAGMIRNFVDPDFNARYGKRRGYTENISTRRPWRKRGLAGALIARSLRLQRELGLTESALGVDTANPTGALQVYERMGFRPVRRFTAYRKHMDP